ncbi:MAG TPA: methyltransferase domain-containing protein [Acidimicrobiales bacterium]|nr:methyltransferase domain-containing protein [Acidimicrobiales bacterium]
MAYLDATDAGLAASKAYVAAAAARAVGSGGVVLDLGCGLGHDLARLEAAGLTAIGLDTSAVMLGVARRRRGPSDRLVQADGAGLPFASGSLDGCRIERVLQHVEQPEAVVAEVRRVLRPGGFVAIFEPDYLTFRVESDVVPDGSLPASMLRVRHPAVGGRLVGLLSDAGFRIEDVVTESSRGYSVDLLPIALDLVLTRAVADGRLDGSLAARWTDEQRRRTSAGTFRARWDKVLVIAGAPEADEASD